MEITKDNFIEVQEGLNSLIKNKEFLLNKIKEYPLQITLANRCWTIICHEELDWLIRDLQNYISVWLHNNSVNQSPKVSVRINIDVEYYTNNIPVTHLSDAISNHLNLHMKNILNSVWEDYDGANPTINNVNVHVGVEDI